MGILSTLFGCKRDSSTEHSRLPEVTNDDQHNRIYKRGSFALYLNGIEEARWQEPNLIAASDDDLRIAHQSLSEVRCLDGIIDEVRVSNTARSADWIRAQYLSQSGAYVTMEDE